MHDSMVPAGATSLVDDLGSRVAYAANMRRPLPPTEDEGFACPRPGKRPACRMSPCAGSSATLGLSAAVGSTDARFGCFFAGKRVATRPIWSASMRVLALPVDWWKKDDYRVLPTPTFARDAHTADWEDHNERVAAAGERNELAWEITGVSAVQLKVVCGTLREVSLLNWENSWIPLNWIQGPQGPRLAATRGQADYARWCTLGLTRFLAKTLPEDGWSPKAHAVEAYAEIEDEEGEKIVLVKAQWAHSWEHSGHLALDSGLWLYQCRQRVKACDRLLNEALSEEDSQLVADFREKSLHDVKRLTPSDVPDN